MKLRLQVSPLLPFSAQWSSIVCADLEEPIKLLERGVTRSRCALEWHQRGWCCHDVIHVKVYWGGERVEVELRIIISMVKRPRRLRSSPRLF
jgi:hypothetical protein